MKILVIEDDVNISFALERFFAVQGDEVTTCLNLKEAFQIHPERQDIIILDLNLPDGEGFEYLTYIRTQGIETPLLLLTVRDHEKDIIKGLMLGADDYLVKPFSLPILRARMVAILRRASLGDGEQTLHCGKLALHQPTKTVLVDDRPLDLSSKEYDLLELFMENQGLTLPRERILDRIWGWERGHVYDNTLSVSIKRLRDKLAPYQDYIRTVRGIGYRMEEGEGEE